MTSAVQRSTTCSLHFPFDVNFGFRFFTFSGWKSYFLSSFPGMKSCLKYETRVWIRPSPGGRLVRWLHRIHQTNSKGWQVKLSEIERRQNVKERKRIRVRRRTRDKFRFHVQRDHSCYTDTHTVIVGYQDSTVLLSSIHLFSTHFWMIPTVATHSPGLGVFVAVLQTCVRVCWGGCDDGRTDGRSQSGGDGSAVHRRRCSKSWLRPRTYISLPFQSDLVVVVGRRTSWRILLVYVGTIPTHAIQFGRTKCDSPMFCSRVFSFFVSSFSINSWCHSCFITCSSHLWPVVCSCSPLFISFLFFHPFSLSLSLLPFVSIN